MSSIIEESKNRIVGTVSDVATNNISVQLENDAPQTTALNTKYPMSFPRINGYLIIPNEIGGIVGLITSVKTIRTPNRLDNKIKSSGLVELPFLTRMVSLSPLSTIHYEIKENGESSLVVQRGVDVYPSVGDSVVLPTKKQIQAIVEGESEKELGRFSIGHYPTTVNAKVYVEPNKLFGQHMAVLGNTGSGKSCTVAGLIRWCIESTNERESKDKQIGQQKKSNLNARFIILDPNGEYSQAFSDFNRRLYQAEPDGDEAKQLKVPAWFWSGEEWAAFTGAASGVQKPILFEAIRLLKSGVDAPNVLETEIKARTKRYINLFKIFLNNGDHQVFPGIMKVVDALKNIIIDYNIKKCEDNTLIEKFTKIRKTAENIETKARGNEKPPNDYYYNAFSEKAIFKIIKILEDLAVYLAQNDEEVIIDENVPKIFSINKLHEFVEMLASVSSNKDLTQFVDTLNMRIRNLFANTNLSRIVCSNDTEIIALEDWLTDYIGEDVVSDQAITIIDLSLLPSDTIHIVVSVLTRMAFEALQRYRRKYSRALPTVLVLEEAHRFINRDLNSDVIPAASRICYRNIERIAREGRKFGLGLVLASQRPYEISPTVLSQCNTFILHRIVNSFDQELVMHMVPDAQKSILQELTSLPSRRAIILGRATPSPVLVDIRELPSEQRPKSPDPEYFGTCVSKKEKVYDRSENAWKPIVEEWTGTETFASKKNKIQKTND